jgi:hypothetical protein
MTLFGNILQNPQDPRARSDVRLMNLVVGFLSMLGAEEENGSVKRMLGVCSEFERIAKVVLDKTERESSSRKKRKSHEDKGGLSGKSNIPNTPMQQMNGLPQGNRYSGTPNGMAGVPTRGNFPPMSGNGNQPSPAPSNATVQSMNWNQNGMESKNGMYSDQDYMATPRAGMTPFAEIQAYSNANANGNGLQGSSPLNNGEYGTFQQPFVPPDMWQMPMTLEWDWADITGGAYPSFENANSFGNDGGYGDGSVGQGVQQ